MATYKDIEAIIWNQIRIGQSYTLPAPIDKDTTRFAVLVFTCDRKTFAANEPSVWLILDTVNEKAEKQPVDYFGEVAFCTSEPSDPAAARSHAERYKEDFGNIGNIGNTSKIANNLWLATQPSLRPYLLAAAPRFFEGVVDEL